jgi:hypothetical protein
MTRPASARYFTAMGSQLRGIGRVPVGVGVQIAGAVGIGTTPAQALLSSSASTTSL